MSFTGIRHLQFLSPVFQLLNCYPDSSADHDQDIPSSFQAFDRRIHCGETGAASRLDKHPGAV